MSHAESLSDKREILLLAELVCVGQAEEQDYARLNTLLNGNYQNTQVYLSYLDTHAQLGLMGTDLSPQPALKYLKKHTPKINKVDYRIAYYMSGMTLMLVLFLGMGIYTYINTHDAVAVIKERLVENLKSNHWVYRSAVNRNTTYKFETGMITLAFSRGTQVTLKGPCKFIPRGPLTIELLSGELAAYMHDPNVQFRVLTKELNIVDLGTGFGVKVGEKNSEVHVFSGKVAVNPTDLAQNEMRILESEHAISFDKNTNQIESINNDIDSFSTWKHQLREALINVTGQDLETGQQDQKWYAINTTTGEQFNTYVLTHLTNLYDRKPYNHSQWISSHPTQNDSQKDPNLQPNDAEFVYFTEFVLNDVDLETMRLNITYWADNQVFAIRMNGHQLDQPEANSRQFTTPNSATIKNHFVTGKNRLEFVIKNGDLTEEQTSSTTRSAMAFRAEIEAIAHDKVP